MRTFSLLALFALLFIGCGPSASENTDEAAAEDATEEEAPKITLTPMPETKDYPEAKMTSMTYQDGTFSFGVDGGGTYELAAQTPDAESLMCANSGQGQHIHLIVDNEPYAAKYEAEFGHEVSDGEHYILSFLSRSYHESLKHPEAAKAVKVGVEGQSFTTVEPITDPMLFYSRPKGTYKASDTENLMLDFYPVNVELGEEYQVKVEVGGETFMVDTWQPYFFKGLPMGEHTITLTLVDKNGNAVDAPLNPVSRTITLAATLD